MKEDAKITERVLPIEMPRDRPVVAAALGCELEGVSRPQADPADIPGLKKAMQKRSCMAPPKADPHFVRGMHDFAGRWARKTFTPLDPSTDLSVETWLKNAPYPEWRKAQLQKAWDECDNPNDPKFQKIKGFVKDESYDDWKYARLINPRHDVFLCLVGPIFTAIEKEVFKHPAFIKGIPRDQWANYVSETLIPNFETYAMDFEAMEAHCTADMQEAEFKVYDYLCSRLAEGPWFRDLCRRVFGGEQVMIYKFLRIVMRAVRASGDRQTSLGNGLLNLITIEYLSEVLGSKSLKIVEGDDNLSQWLGNKPTKELYARLGWTVKIEVHPTPELASFCGLIFDPHDRVNIGDPLKAMAKFGWTSRNYMKARSTKLKMLAKAKAYSALYQFTGCPIISDMAMWVIRQTAHIDLRPLLNSGSLNAYEREELQKAISNHWRLAQRARVRPSMATRLLMEQKFGVSITRQLKMERWFQESRHFVPIPNQLVIDLVPKSWVDYSDRYVHMVTMDEDFDKGENL